MEVYNIKEFIIRSFRPTSLVLATPGANLLCAENSLNPAELLSPFCDFRKEQIIFNMFDKSAYLLNDFVIDLIGIEDYRIEEEKRREICRNVLENNPPKFNFDDVFLIPNIKISLQKLM